MALFAGGLTIAAVLANKLITAFGFVMPAGVLAYSITYPITDITAEVWGRRQAAKVVWSGFLALLLVIGLCQVALRWPAPDFWDGQPAFAQVVGSTRRIIVASLCAYLASQLLGAPGATVPRRCVARYEAARAALIDNPRPKQAWRQFAELCDQLDKELEAYGKKPGSSQEKLSFSAEAQFARGRLDSADSESLEKLWPPSAKP